MKTYEIGSIALTKPHDYNITQVMLKIFDYCLQNSHFCISVVWLAFSFSFEARWSLLSSSWLVTLLECSVTYNTCCVSIVLSVKLAQAVNLSWELIVCSNLLLKTNSSNGLCFSQPNINSPKWVNIIYVSFVKPILRLFGILNRKEIFKLIGVGFLLCL